MKKKAYISSALFLLIFLIGSISLKSEEIVFVVKASTMPSPRSSPMAAVVGSDIYTLGGHGVGSGTYNIRTGMRENEVYHTASDTWEQKTSIPEYRGAYGFRTAVAGSKIFMFGGANPPGSGHYNYINMYDISSNSWTASVATLPYPLAGAVAVVYNGDIYVFGGRSGAESGSSQPHRKVALRFDPNTYTSTNLSEYPRYGAGGEAFAIGNMIYIVGGYTVTDPNIPYGTLDSTPPVLVYMPGTDSWITKGDVPISGRQVLVNGTIYIIATDLSSAYKYNLNNDSWTFVSTQFPNDTTGGFRETTCYAGVGGKIYFLGGTSNTTQRLNTVIEGTINPDTYTLHIESTPDTGVPITVTPLDNNNEGNGSTDFSRIYDSGTVVNLTAPASHNGKFFVKWLIDGFENTNSTVQVTMDTNYTAQAVYQSFTYTLTVKSSPDTGVPVTITPLDNNNKGNGSTKFSRIYDSGTVVTLTAPTSHNGKYFAKWLIDGTKNNNSTAQVTMDSNHTAQAVYQSPTYTLTVQSAPDNGVPVTITPLDNNNTGNGSTEFSRIYDSGAVVTLTAPASHNGKYFVKWLIDGTENSNSTIQVTMDANHLVKAVFQTPQIPTTYMLTVQSSPGTGIVINVSPEDNMGAGDGITDFTRTYNPGETVTLTAPFCANGSPFIKWMVDGQDNNSTTIEVTMSSNHTAAAYYEPANPPKIAVNRKQLNFIYVIGSSVEPSERFIVYNSGGGTVNWTASCEAQNVTLSPPAGSNYGEVEVTIHAEGHSPGKYDQDVIYVSDPMASDSPEEIKINLWVKTRAEASRPFGDFATPIDGSSVCSSIPVTGWALGDTALESVKIYREEGGQLFYIGDAIFVEGARPDIEAAYPDYPRNYKAGWGYMMLTNFLPDGGNGIYKIHAIAADKEGQRTTLGVKTITVNNADAVNPFGEIDTPTQGGSASGNQFFNWGWVLTPVPNIIPTNGKTIDVFVDGVKLGNPTYDIYRSDIASLFPDYLNSDGALGCFCLDTTGYENGVHTIQWTVTDNAGNTDGIGSRYFSTWNTGSCPRKASESSYGSLGVKEHNTIPLNFEPVRIRIGYGKDAASYDLSPGINSTLHVETRELERIVIELNADQDEATFYSGYMLVGDQTRPLPAGSRLDNWTGVFHWQTGVGFYGEYRLVFFEKKPDGRMARKDITVKIGPKNP